METGTTFESVEHCQNWLNQVAIRQASEGARTDIRHNEILQESAEQRTARGEERHRLAPYVEDMLHRLPELPEEERALIERYYLDEIPLRILVEEFKLGSIPTAWRRLQEILAKLKEMLEPPDGWDE